MRPKIVITFNNIDDAKSAFGQIKKESWNQANFAVVFAEISKTSGDFEYEFAGENFIGEPTARQEVWPGVRETELSGIGKVYLGTDFENSLIINEIAGRPDLQRQLQEQKIIAVLEVDAKIKERVETVLANNGAEFISPEVTVF